MLIGALDNSHLTELEYQLDESQEDDIMLVGEITTSPTNTTEETSGSPEDLANSTEKMDVLKNGLSGDYTSSSIRLDSAELELTTIASVNTAPPVASEVNEVVLDHHIFDSVDGWRKAESMPHPTLRLRVSTDPSDYQQLSIPCPQIMPSYTTTVTDTGAQSNLWGLDGFYASGFQDSDLRPVRRSIHAANKEEIEIVGAVFLRLTGIADDGTQHTAAVMVYITPCTSKFFLSREALIQLRVIPKNFPKVGSVPESSEVSASTVDTGIAPCGCPLRQLPPGRPNRLPFEPIPDNIPRMQEWILEYYKGSTFNQCTHQLLKGITGPDMQFHVDESVKPVAVHTPAVVALHHQEKVRKGLEEDCSIGVLEKVPYGQPSKWCHRMVVARKSNGEPRRTVDMSALNKACLRETHHVEPPFRQARCVPANTWKTTTDALNGFHSVPLREEDRHLTTFMTQWGRFRYRVAPQGFIASGDAFTRRYDEVIADVERIKKCTDDTISWDDELEEHWWRMIDYFELVGRNGIILNPSKLQFCRREVDFAGFRISENTVKPLEKYLRAIAEFPTPKNISDIRGWFGLVNQVSQYDKLIHIMAPFKPFLSPAKKFEWTEELNTAFEKSKIEIIRAIREGVEIFDPGRRTCLRPDYSTIGIGYFLSQKHCTCKTNVPGCCESGWRITLAGSRFLKLAEMNYAPIEGEALAITWALKHAKYFTLGCDNLVVVTDHKPLVGHFNDKRLDEIDNPRLLNFRQKTGMWRFQVVWKPGKDNKFADATSRNPAHVDDDPNDDISISEILATIMSCEEDEDVDEDLEFVASLAYNRNDDVKAVTWEMVRDETTKDQQMRQLISLIESCFPDSQNEVPPHLRAYWKVRNDLYVKDGVILMRDQVLIPTHLRGPIAYMNAQGTPTRVIIPTNLRRDILNSLDFAHQGVSSMSERANAGVYWVGITNSFAIVVLVAIIVCHLKPVCHL